MTNWQKRARFGVAVFGIATAIGVYAVMGERAQPVAVTPPARLDPKAVIESQGNVLQQVRGARQDYLIEAERQLTYEGGATKLIGVKVSIRNRAGRDYVITAREASAGERQQELHLTGAVTLEASDGFTIATEEAFFTETDGTVRAPGAFSFGRGQMSGTGAGMSYDEQNDVLSIAGDADVRITDEGGNTRTQFTAGSAVFTRPQHLLTLGGVLHVLHNEQVIDAEQGAATLTEDDARVASIALRGRAEVKGGGQGLDSMSADSMDLDYAEDGQALERVVLTGTGRVAMTGGEGRSGRQISGGVLDITLAPDGSLTTLTGKDGVELALEGSSAATARTVVARSMEGNGEAGRGLRSVRFRDAVEFREAARAGAAARTVTANALAVVLETDAVESALFTGNVRFDEQALQASGGEALYEPGRGTLRLTEGAGRTRPRVADEQVTVDATRIDVTLEGRAMDATGNVKSTLRPRRATDKTRLPGLLKQGQPTNISADRFTYEGSAGKAVYSGSAALLQGDTAIRAQEITIDQTRGDLVASGDARSTLALDGEATIGRGREISYVDGKRLITYEGSAARPATAAAPAVPAALAQVSGPQRDLRAARIEIVLAAGANGGGGGVERLEAYTDVTLKVDARTATGARLTYFAPEERYLMTGLATVPVRVVEQCRQIQGRTLTFFKAADKIIVDGNEESRTQTTTGGACAQPTPPPAR